MSQATLAYRRGIELEDAGRAAEAQAAYREAIELDPSHARALNNLGALLEAEGRADEALDAYRRAVAADPALLVAAGNLAALLHRSGSAEEGAAVLGGLLAAPGTRGPDEWYALGNTAQGMGRHDDAVRCFEQACAASPAFREAGLARATSLLNLGHTTRALEAYRELLAMNPADVDIARKRLLALAFEPCSTEEYFNAHLDAWKRIPAAPSAPPPPGGPSRDRLRVGYVSADFCVHPMGLVLAPIIEAHDRAALDLFLYSGVTQPDGGTRWFQERAGTWRPIAGLSDEEAGRRIREDGIDVLVHVAGHFDDNRPLLARQRAAPVQVSFWDTATSGLAEMDYLIADRCVAPHGSPERFTERVVCIPTSYVRTMVAAPEAPARRPRAGVVFGSFNAPAKISEPALRAWADVLRRVPSATLLFQYQDVFSNPSARERIVRVFESAGIASDRLRFEGRPAGRSLDRYTNADIALDPFPFNGMTTTFEALWAGVPVVALEGDRMVGRCAAMALRKVGLQDWIARDASDYARIAERFASDPATLDRLRMELRGRVERSPLCAARPRARQLERLYRALWRRAQAGLPPTRTTPRRRRSSS